ncbi:hypothetical protein EDC02_2861 [Micromonospora sp. Llam0]|nr:hypothetical protein EDC02_2861 [Micromonospora sp. Llam0]
MLVPQREDHHVRQRQGKWAAVQERPGRLGLGSPAGDLVDGVTPVPGHAQPGRDVANGRRRVGIPLLYCQRQRVDHREWVDGRDRVVGIGRLGRSPVVGAVGGRVRVTVGGVAVAGPAGRRVPRAPAERQRRQPSGGQHRLILGLGPGEALRVERQHRCQPRDAVNDRAVRAGRPGRVNDLVAAGVVDARLLPLHPDLAAGLQVEVEVGGRVTLPGDRDQFVEELSSGDRACVPRRRPSDRLSQRLIGEATCYR